MTKLTVNRVDSTNGDLHFIIEENALSKPSEHSKDFDLAEIKKISKEEASKPLALARK